jgi:hypothetical protein
MITTRDIAAAEHIIDTSGAVDILLQGRKRSNRGRKTNRTHWRLYLIGGLLTVQHCGNFVITDIHRTLVERLPYDEQFRLGVRRWVTDHTTGERHLKIITKADLDNVTKAINNSLGYGRSTGSGLDHTEQARRRAVIQHYCDALMDVFDLGWTSTTYAMDATGIWSWARGRAKPANTATTNHPAEPPDTTTHETPDTAS